MASKRLKDVETKVHEPNPFSFSATPESKHELCLIVVIMKKHIYFVAREGGGGAS